jgi:hypothetical protein
MSSGCINPEDLDLLLFYVTFGYVDGLPEAAPSNIQCGFNTDA